VRILLTNDDGVWADGLQSMIQALQDVGEVVVVAPEREQSAASHALTLDRPLRIRAVRAGVFSVDGTPTDCVLLAVRGVPGVLKVQPDLVVSGINHGGNMGDDVNYSGTVAAAAEGCLMGIPSIAISLASWEPVDFAPSGRVGRVVVEQVMARGLPSGTLLNVNVPDLRYEEIRGIRVTRLGKRVYSDPILEQRDPRGKPCYWIGGERPRWDPTHEADFQATQEGFVSVTPLRLDLTHHQLVEEIRGWNLVLPGGGESGAP
jgi:5'-nucleotidase